MANRQSVRELSPIVIRRSIVLFIIRMILMELIFEIIYLTWRGLIHFLPLQLETIITLNIVSIILFFLFVTVLQNIFLIYITLKWVNDYYEIRTDEIAHIHGIFSKTEKAYPYSDIQSITVHQGLLGRLFDYGSVRLYIPTLGHDLHFSEVSSPTQFVEMVKSANPKLESGKYIFRR